MNLLKKTIKSEELKPIIPKYSWDDNIIFGSVGEEISSEYGMTLHKNDISDLYKDISFSRQMFIGVIGKKDIKDILKDTSFGVYDNKDELIYVGDFLISLRNNNHAPHLLRESKIYEANGIIERININPSKFNLEDSSDIKIFKLYKKIEDNSYQIKYMNKWLGFDTFGDDLIVRLMSTQYNIFLKKTSQKNYEVNIDETLKVYNASSENYETFNKICFSKPDAHNVYLDIEENKLIRDGFVGDNKYVGYEIPYKPHSSKIQSELIPQSDIIKNVELDYVINGSYYNMIKTEDYYSLPIDIIPLKNFKSINSDQLLITIDNGTIDKNSISFRNYNRIYTGGNVVDGFQELNLGYDSNYGMVLNIRPDGYTYFHIPESTPEILLNDTNLKLIGATAGKIPAYSDRIYKKIKNYEDHIWWGGDDSQLNVGDWLCAWLSAGDTDSIWVERYYDPGIINYNDALEYYDGNEYIVKEASGGEFITGSGVYDVVSNMKLTPGSYIKYYHIGRETIKNKISSFYDNNDNFLIRYLKFEDSDKVLDYSGNENNGNIINGDKADIIEFNPTYGEFEHNGLMLNGESEIKIPYSESFSQFKDEKSIIFWTYMDDWENKNKQNKSSSIYSNYFDGTGDKIEYIDHGLYYSLIIPTNSDSDDDDKIVVLNSVGEKINESIKTPLDEIMCAVDLDGYLWVCGWNEDSRASNIYKLTPDGVVIKGTTSNDHRFDQMLVKDDNVMLLKAGDEVYELNIHTLLLNPDRVYELSGDEFYIWYEEGGIIKQTDEPIFDVYYKDDAEPDLITPSELIYTSLFDEEDEGENYEIQSLCCDDDRNIYFIYNKPDSTTYGVAVQKLTRLERDVLTPIKDGTIECEGSIPSNNKIFINKEFYKDKIENIIYWITSNGRLRKYFLDKKNNTFSSIGDEIVLSESVGNIKNLFGDFSGYKLNAKQYHLNEKNTILKYSIILEDDSSSLINKKVLIYKLENIIDNWNFISCVKSKTDLSLYINGVEADRIESAGNIKLSTESYYGIGTDIGRRNKSISERLKENFIYNGSISKFEILNIPLHELNIKSIYSMNLLKSEMLEWPIATNNKNFIENIKTFYKFRPPGMKSQYYNIILRNTNLTNEEKKTFETRIRNIANENTHDGIRLKDIIWK